MKMLSDAHLRRDLIKLACVAGAIAGTGAVFLVTPALSTPTLLSIVITMLLSPLVAGLERRGHPRTLSILIIFGTLGVATVALGFWAMQTGVQEWDSFKEQVPYYFQLSIQKLKAYEDGWKLRYSFMKTVHPTDTLVAWGEGTGKWFVTHGPALMGELLSCLFVVPILSFVMLNDGRSIRMRFFQLVPNRFFESVFMVTNEIMTSLSDYLRAKMFEAFLVAVMTAGGLALIKAPYAIVLGIAAGVTNIVPYLGPVLGAVPGILIALLDSSQSGLLWPIVAVYSITNLIDMLLIFPVIVAKLVDLHPLILIAVVAVGQQYYGLVGMLISIPIATTLKVVLQEIYSAVYEERTRRKAPVETTPYESPLLRAE